MMVYRHTARNGMLASPLIAPLYVSLRYVLGDVSAFSYTFPSHHYTYLHRATLFLISLLSICRTYFPALRVVNTLLDRRVINLVSVYLRYLACH